MAWRPESDEAPDHWEPLFYGDDGMVTFANEAEAERAVMRARDDGRVVVGTILAFAPLEYTALVWEHPELHSLMLPSSLTKAKPSQFSQSSRFGPVNKLRIRLPFICPRVFVDILKVRQSPVFMDWMDSIPL
jgi:hypothetical protein